MNLYNILNNEINLEELLHYYNANVTYIKLPKGVNGCIFNHRGIFNIFIKKELSKYKKKKTIIHELAHLELNHLNQINNDLFAFCIDKYEDEADRYVKFLLGERL